MIKGIFHSAAGMSPRMSQQEVVANNLANVNTTGFKADFRHFRAALNNKLLQGGDFGEPVKTTEELFFLQTDFSSGPIDQTRNPLDVAIVGKGFFAIETGEVTSYTRNGNFKINQDYELTDQRGYRVLGEAGPIRINGQNLRIKDNGEVYVDDELVDTLRIVDFEEPYPLKRNGYGYFVPNRPVDTITPEEIKMEQGALERSNVNPILQMTAMIELNRDYESCQKAIQAQDETLGKAVNEIAGR
ncbi:flagellar basal-body rod protein FlgF [Calditrichota bacterium]